MLSYSQKQIASLGSKGLNNASLRENSRAAHELGGDPHLAAAALRSTPRVYLGMGKSREWPTITATLYPDGYLSWLEAERKLVVS